MQLPRGVSAARSGMALLVAFQLLVSVSAIKCLQCTSLKERQCESGHMTASQCPQHKNRYCIKYTGDSDGFVFRSCSQVEKKRCENVEVVPGVTMHVCFHTCYTDGCNMAVTMTSLHVGVLLAIALACCKLATL